MNSTVTIRLVPIPGKTVGSGQHARALPGVSAERLASALRSLIEPEVKRKFGAHVEVVFQEGKVPDIRLDGVFTEKAARVRQEVGELLGEAFGALDPTELVEG